jgi:hypothetical protein
MYLNLPKSFAQATKMGYAVVAANELIITQLCRRCCAVLRTSERDWRSRQVWKQLCFDLRGEFRDNHRQIGAKFNDRHMQLEASHKQLETRLDTSVARLEAKVE